MKRMSQDKRSYNLAASTATLRWHGDTHWHTQSMDTADW